MKRILVYSSLSVLTAIGTVFTAANAEFLKEEETSPTTASQPIDDVDRSTIIGTANPTNLTALDADTPALLSAAKGGNRLSSNPMEQLSANSSNPFLSALNPDATQADIQPITLAANGAMQRVPTGTTQVSPVIGQTPDTTAPSTIPTPKPSAAEPIAPEADADAGITDSVVPAATGVETLSPVPGSATPLSPVPANGITPATPPGSPVLPAPPGSSPIENAPITPGDVESDAFDAPSAEEPEMEEDPFVEDDMEEEEDSGMEEEMPMGEEPMMEDNPDIEDSGIEDSDIEDSDIEEGDSEMTDETEDDETEANESLIEDDAPLPAAPGSGFTPGAPSAPNGITPSAPDGNFTPSAPNGITPSAPDSNFTPSAPNGLTPSAPNGIPSNGLTPNGLPTEPNGVTPITPLTPEAPPAGSPAPAMPPAPLTPTPEAPTEALPPINDSSFDDDGFNESTPLGSTSDRLIGEGFTPFQLSYLAISGGLKEAGIPGGNLLLSAYESGELSAEDIVAAGAMTKRLGTAANDEAGYTKGVDKFLKLLSREGLNS